jgi:Domain of unknown function (DUF4265)
VKTISILFPVEDTPGIAHEGLQAVRLPNGTYRIENIPFYTTLVSYQDTVKAKADGDVLHFQAVDTRGGHTTFVFAFVKSVVDPAEFLEFVERLELKCEVDLDLGFISVDIAPHQSADRFYEDFDLLGLPDGAFCLEALCDQH